MSLLEISVAGGPGLILKANTGFLYTNQAGGHRCVHPTEEGVYFPLIGDLSALEEVFGAATWETSEEEAHRIAAIVTPRRLPREGFPRGYRLEGAENIESFEVDHGRLTDSFEAWVHCRCIIKGKIFDAVLTWGNSD